jgi:hypothetical protein
LQRPERTMKRVTMM